MSRRRRWAYAAAALCAVPVLLLSIGVAAAALGVTIDASRWRDTAAQRAAAALGRPVSLQGAVELSLGRTPQLRLGELRILNPPGFSGPQFLEIGELRLRFDLFDALRGRWRLRSVEASDVQLWLERAADGRGNWMTPPRDPGEPPATIDVDRVKLQRLGLHYHDARTAARHAVALESVSGSAVRHQPLQLAVRGQLEPGRAYVLELEGGPLQQLQDAAEPWPFEIELRSRGARLHAGGALDTRQRAARMRVEAHADDPAAIARLAGAQVPALGRAMLHGTLSLAADAVSVTELQGWLGESEFSGQLALALGGARPRLRGALRAATLDLGPFLAASPDAPGEPRDGDAPSPPLPPLRELAALDVELDVQVERALGLPLELRDATLALRADAQGLRAPLGLTLARVPFTGRLDLDTATPVPSFALQLNANDAVLGELARELGYASGIDGTLGRLALRIDGRGPTLAALAGDLELSLAVAAARLRFGNDASGRPLNFALDTLDLSLRRGQPLRGQARGTLRGEPARLSLRGGTLQDMLRERALPLDLELALAQAQARLRLQGVLPWDDAHREAVLRFDFQSRRAGDLAHWIGVAPEASVPVALRGQLRRVDAAWMLEPTTLELGRSRLTLAARRSLAEGRPVIMASVRSALIDVQELSTLRAGSRAPRDAPVFADAFDIADADVDVQLQRLLLGRAELEDMAFVARSRDARLLPVAVTGRLAAAPFTAEVTLDLHGELPTASLDLSTGSIELGALLRGLGL
ncbi:MAG: AsmA family protein, partial [Burkholderiaceae bacterium]|nr:AsmA family protein [Burkholderiaceae bacterium]